MPARIRKSVHVEIGERVRQERKKQGMTREIFAQLTGYSLSFIQEIERGRSGLSSESMKRVCEVLSISADYLLYGDAAPQGRAANIAKRVQVLDGAELEYLEQIIDAYINSHTKRSGD